MLRNHEELKQAQKDLWNYEVKMFLKYGIEEEGVNINKYISDAKKVREKIENRELGLTDEEWKEWNQKYQRFVKARDSRFTARYGFIPEKFNLFKILTSMFLHGGIDHLIGNMWFLWLVGCNIEDEWGRPLFLGFYILSGFVASLIFAIIAGSNIPLIGASGAIAGVMGAFAVRHYKTRIHFLFVWLLPPIITTFSIIAGIVLPFWFVYQLFSAFVFSEIANVAFWAHVGGFAFGVCVVFILRYYELEEKFVTPLVNDTLNLIDRDFSKAVEARSMGDTETAETLLKENLQEDSLDFRSAEEIIDLYCETNRELEAGKFARRFLNAMKKDKVGSEQVINFYESEIEGRNLCEYLKPYNFYYIAEQYKKVNKYKKASRILGNAYKYHRKSDDAPYILLRLIRALIEIRDKKFLKKAFYELKSRFPEFEGRAREIIKGVNNGI